MSVTINVNGLSLAHRGSNGMATATMPDVCKTPSPGGPPIPVPYPNVAVSKDLAKGTITVLVDGGNMAAIHGSELAVSTGDEAGTAGGVVSSTFMKEATWLLYSFDVLLEGKWACRLTDKLFMNHMNTVCLGGWIQQWLKKHRNKSDADACKALFEYIMGLLDDNGRGGYQGRGLDGPEGRFAQNTNGGSLGARGAPNAPRTRGPVPGYPNGANDWETHDSELKKQQNELNERLDELDDDCGGGSRKQQKELDRARDAAKRKAPTKEDWNGPLWEPEPQAAPSPSMSTEQKLVIVGAVLLIGGGLLAAAFTGGTSLAATAAGVAILAVPAAGVPGSQTPGGA